MSLNDLPNEVIQQILHHVPPLSILAFQQVCKRFNGLADQLLWRYHCRTQFRYWTPENQTKSKLWGNIDGVDWKGIFAQRHKIDRATSSAIDSILSSQMGRIDKVQRIVEYGYDAKDCLLRHLEVNEEAEDVLARRYYSDAILGCLHRTMAIKEWSRLKDTQDVSLERALSAFDMFVLSNRKGDFDEISSRLDEIADRIRSEHLHFDEQTPRQKAISIATYLRANQLTGLKHVAQYQDLQNCFLGIALHDEDHPSLPLISTAIFCCVSKRLGLDAEACSFPFYVVAIVKPPRGYDLNSNPLPDDVAAKPMYMDPFESDSETPLEDLVARLRAVGASEASHSMLLEASPTSEIILRMSRNIVAAVRTSHRSATGRNGHGSPEHLVSIHSFPDMGSAFYGALWAFLLLGIPPDGDGPIAATIRRPNYLPYIVEHFETHFPTDITLIENYIIPLFHTLGESAQLRESVRVVRVVDSMPKQTKLRTKEISQHVKYRVGQVFRHKRYNYKGVIIGWDVECGANEHWMAQMRIHELAQGRHQSFYHVLVEDKSVRYVAEENIEIETPALPHSLMALAGRHFKRWDKKTHSFVSNIKDEYPDD